MSLNSTPALVMIATVGMLAVFFAGLALGFLLAYHLNLHKEQHEA